MTNGKAIAMTVAGLLLAAAPSVGHADDKTKDAKVKCTGINSCKGKGACSAASNGCAGHNACKGKGWLEVTTKECKDQGGTVVAEKDAKDKADKEKAKEAPKKK